MSIKKGWYEIAGKPDKTTRNFIRKSSGQKVRFETNDAQIDHYHWYNANPTIPKIKVKTIYMDRYGIPCTNRDDRRHLAPLVKIVSIDLILH